MTDHLSALNILSMILDKNHIKHFSMEEVMSGWDIPLNLIPNIEHTIVFLDNMRDELGFPISITSSYRSKEFNKLVGGVKDSMHLRFNALDSVPTSGQPRQLWYMEVYALKYRIKGMGIGLYNTFLHIDTRYIFNKHTAFWDKRL